MLVIAGTVAVFLLPFFPVDETRYLTVAWEMKLNHSLVPLLHGAPYSHKPPLLFALINLDWFIFGVNEKTLRCIPLVFSLFNITIIYKISLTIWKDEKIAKYSSIIMASTLIYLVWSTLIMFDIILTFFVLVGIYGLISASKSNIRKGLALISISIGGGLLTKGPVIFAHLLPVSLLYFLWRPKDGLEIKRWYFIIFFGVLIGTAIALLWVVPAAVLGGKEYREAILWGQTANRMVSSFAHKQPIWWYLPILPALFFPWFFYKPAWHGFSVIKHDEGYRFVVVWALATIVVFSLISGKQVYYLIPMLPAGCLLAAKNIATFDMTDSEQCKLHYPFAIIYVILGSFILATQFITSRSDLGSISFSFIALLSSAFICLGIALVVIKGVSREKLIKIIAFSSLIAFIVAGFAVSNQFFMRYKVSNFAQILREKQEQGYNIIHYRKYHGQYQFLGRLTDPLIVFVDDKSVNAYLKKHKKTLIITYEKPDENIDTTDILYQQLYLGKKVVLWKEMNQYSGG